MDKFKFTRHIALTTMIFTIIINIVVFHLHQSLNGLLFTSLSGVLLALVYTADWKHFKKERYLLFCFLSLILLQLTHFIANQLFIKPTYNPLLLALALNLILIFIGIGLVIKTYSRSKLDMTYLKFSFLVLLILGAYSFFTVVAQKKINSDLNNYFVYFLLSGSAAFLFRDLIFQQVEDDNQSKGETRSITKQASLQNPETIQEKITLFFNENNTFTNPNFNYNDFINALPFSRTEISSHLNHYQKTSFYQILGEERAKYAAKQLEENKLYSIEGIMLEAGFKSYSSFISNFKRVYGMSPSQYRSKYFN